MCEYLIDENYVKAYNSKIANQTVFTNGTRTTLDRTQILDICKNYANRLLQLGL